MKIIVPIKPHSYEDFEVLVKKINNRANFIEIWLDQIEDLTFFLQKLKTQKITKIPFLGVCKTPRAKGKFEGTEDERIKILQSFLEAGGDFVDLDITQNSVQNIKKIDPQKLYLSFHDFERIPENIEAIFKKMEPLNPAVYKFAVTPHSKKELKDFLDFARQKIKIQGNFIFTTMGDWGSAGRKKLSSVSFAGFYALDNESKTASGQLCLDDL